MIMMRTVLAPGVTLKSGLFKPNSEMTMRLPAEKKTRVLAYLLGVPDACIADCQLFDPVTGERYETTNIVREKDGFTWSTHVIYMFERYDVKLAQEFLAVVGV